MILRIKKVLLKAQKKLVDRIGSDDPNFGYYESVVKQHEKEIEGEQE